MTFDPFAPGLLTRLPRPPQKVVLLRASRIGDFLCATPALRALRLALPDAEISMITLPMLQELACRSSHLDRVLPFPGFPGVAEQLFDARQGVRFIQQMQDERFDLAIQMQGSGVNSNPFTLLLGAQATAGFIRPDDPPGRLDAALPYPSDVHEIRCVQALTEFLGVPNQGDQIEFPLWPQDHAAAAELLDAVKAPLIGLHPSARDATRRWAPERFADLANVLQRRHGGTIVLLGDAEACPWTEMVEQQLEGPYLDLVDKVSLVVLGAIIARLDILITNDSGPAHIAYALNTPTVTIFGGGDPRLNGPFHPGPFRVLTHEVLCRPCGYSTCPIGYVCLKSVKVKEAYQAAERIMR